MFNSTLFVARLAMGVVGFALLGVVVSPTAAAAATPPPITFEMATYDACLAGHSAAGATVSVVWRDPAGTLKAKGSVEASTYGEWTFCPTAAMAVMPGDRVKVGDGSYMRNYVVPNLTVRADRVNQVYRGTGPAGRTIRLWIPNGDWERGHSIRVGQDGTWTFTPVGGLGGSYIVGYTGYVEWTSPNSDHLSAYAFYPVLGVTLGRPNFYGTTAGFGSVTARISGVRNGKGTAIGNGAGDFSGVFRDSNGASVPVMPGDSVSGPGVASDAHFIVPRIDGAANKSTEIVTGKCYDTGTAARYVHVWVIRPGGHVRADFTWSTDEDGTFVADFTDFGIFEPQQANIKTGDRIKIDCLQTTGDFARLTFVVK